MSFSVCSKAFPGCLVHKFEPVTGGFGGFKVTA